MRKFIVLFVIAICMAGLSFDASAQVRKKKTSKKTAKDKEPTEQVNLMDKINPEILIGNIGFFNGFYLSTKVGVGYKLSNRFTVGVGGKLFYNQYAQTGPDPSLFDYGGLIYGRGKITDQIYIQAEYDFMKFAKDPDGYIIRGLSSPVGINYPAIGGGYTSGFGKWRFGIQLMYITNSIAQDYQSSILEYWVGGSYNF